MIMHLANDIAGPLAQSMAAGAASLSDSSICSTLVLRLLVLDREGDLLVVASSSAASRRGGLDRALDAGSRGGAAPPR